MDSRLLFPRAKGTVHNPNPAYDVNLYKHIGAVDPITYESRIPVIRPGDDLRAAQLTELLTERIRDPGFLTNAESIRLWNAKNVVDEIENTVDRNFYLDFTRYLRGESVYNQQPYSDQAPGTNFLYAKGAKEFLDRQIQERGDYQIKLAKLINGPWNTIGEVFLYYKYIVRQRQISKNGTPTVTLVPQQFLADWNRFVPGGTAKPNNAPPLAPPGDPAPALYNKAPGNFLASATPAELHDPQENKTKTGIQIKQQTSAQQPQLTLQKNENLTKQEQQQTSAGIQIKQETSAQQPQLTVQKNENLTRQEEQALKTWITEKIRTGSRKLSKQEQEPDTPNTRISKADALRTAIMGDDKLKNLSEKEIEQTVDELLKIGSYLKVAEDQKNSPTTQAKVSTRLKNLTKDLVNVIQLPVTQPKQPQPKQPTAVLVLPPIPQQPPPIPESASNAPVTPITGKATAPKLPIPPPIPESASNAPVTLTTGIKKSLLDSIKDSGQKTRLKNVLNRISNEPSRPLTIEDELKTALIKKFAKVTANKRSGI